MAVNTMRKSDLTRGVVKRAFQVVFGGLLLTVFMLVPAGRLDWWPAWAFTAIYFGGIVFNALFVMRGDLELMAERGETKENTQGWDKTVSGVITFFTLLTLVVAGLDERVGWSRMAPAVQVFAGLWVVLGFLVVSWSMSANRFFARVVRIQDDRGQAVCSTGPYRFVRHPGYVGMCIYSLALPFMLGSWWAVVPGVLTVAGFVVRTALEDRMLQAELPGYREYAARVRYRLAYGIW